MTQGSENRGAALIIAVAIFAILLAIALTFYSSSRIELQQATNVENGFRTELVTNAGTAQAVSMLQNDLVLYPNATSLDHPWNSFFNGAWIAGKPWAFAGGIPWSPDPTDATAPFDRLATPRVVYDDVLNLRGEITAGVQSALSANDLSRVAWLQGARAPLYIPRFQLTPTLAALESGGFVVQYAFDQSAVDSTFDPSRDGITLGVPLTPQQQIAQWADVDNDEDGLPDSVWIPVPMEEIYGGADKNANGVIEVDEGGDGIDNDLDGFIDEDAETAVFVYWGGNDGLDNDFDGAVDEADEQKLFLTAPIVDQDGNSMFDSINVQVNQDVLKEFIGVPTSDPNITTTVQNDFRTGFGDVDAIDNDYSMIVSDSRGYAYDYLNGNAPPTTDEELSYAAQQATRAYNVIDTNIYPTIAPYQVVSSSGEPACTVAGRVAVLITDESSKINLNTAAGEAVGPGGQTPADGVRLTWAADQGIGTQEVDLRSLPNFDVFTAAQTAQLRNGSPDGAAPFALDTNLDATPYDYDIALPGYGGVDDNGNALTLSLNGIDDDGDAPYYLYDGIDNDFDGAVDNPEEYYVGVDELWEGIDEPAEHQLFRPLRNRLAETDRIDNDLDQSVDEIGEFGDKVFRTKDQVLQISNIGGSKAGWVGNSITTQSTDRNERFQYYTRDESANILQQILPPTSGLKLDYNYALAENIARALQEDWDYPAFTDLLVSIPETRYADGLRREDANIVNAPYGVLDPDSGFIVFEADPELRSYQLALNVMEARDRDHAGNETEVRTPDRWWYQDVGADGDPTTEAPTNDAFGEKRQIRYRMRGLESIRITELMVRPVRRVEAEADLLDPLVPQQFNPNVFSDAAGRPRGIAILTMNTRPSGIAYQARRSTGRLTGSNDGVDI